MHASSIWICQNNYAFCPQPKSNTLGRKWDKENSCLYYLINMPTQPQWSISLKELNVKSECGYRANKMFKYSKQSPPTPRLNKNQSNRDISVGTKACDICASCTEWRTY